MTGAPSRRRVLLGALAASTLSSIARAAPMHVVLLGDSVFDNAPYVAPAEEVTVHLLRRLPPGWEATLLAHDGAFLAGVHEQVRLMPKGATHLVVSAGGNDALGQTSVFSERVGTVADALLRLAVEVARQPVTLASQLSFSLNKR